MGKVIPFEQYTEAVAEIELLRDQNHKLREALVEEIKARDIKIVHLRKEQAKLARARKIIKKRAIEDLNVRVKVKMDEPTRFYIRDQEVAFSAMNMELCRLLDITFPELGPWSEEEEGK